MPFRTLNLKHPLPCCLRNEYPLLHSPAIHSQPSICAPFIHIMGVLPTNRHRFPYGAEHDSLIGRLSTCCLSGCSERC